MTGMVSSIQERHNVHFNAGIWFTFPLESLLWARRKSGRMRRLAALDFPSWTWVGYHGEVEFLSGHEGFSGRRDLEISIMRDDGKSTPFASPMTLIGPVIPLNPDVRIDTDAGEELDLDSYAMPRAIKSSAGEAIGCAMFDDPNDNGEAVECLIVESRPDDHGQQNLLPQTAPGKDSVTAIKVKRGYVTQLIRDSGNIDISSSLQLTFAETGAAFTPADDQNDASFESIDDEGDIRRELQLPEEAGIGPGEDTDVSAVSAAANALDIQGSGGDKLVDEPATAPFRNAWVFTWKYSWIKGYTIVFVRATDSTRTKFARVGMGCLDIGWIVEEQVQLVEIV
jgi:hypothetical protein